MLVGILIAVSAFRGPEPATRPGMRFPYEKAGLTKDEAAAHLLNRFTYGPVPGQVDAVVKQGLENWFEQQLAGALPQGDLNIRLQTFDALTWTNTQILNTYRRNGEVLRMARADGVLKNDSTEDDRKAYRDQLRRYREQHGFRPERDLTRQLVSQKIVRAVYSPDQLREVLTEFWMNHFNVSVTKNACSRFILSYERDAIRPNALGHFEDLLLATARSPAMLLYLDNFSSVASDSSARRKPDSRRRGLNENYAREVMELHTLGVDGGYTQTDVTEAARILTGWTVYPMGDEGFGSGYKKMLSNAGEERLAARGFVHHDDFLFMANRHDKGEKTVLGKHFAAGGGYEEGKTLLHMLARHPATATFIARKIAIRFVSDTPPPALVDRMAKAFSGHNGDIKAVLRALVTSPGFWDGHAVRAKTKSPVELMASSLRALNADVKDPYIFFAWLRRMGQPLYHYQAPTGFPDRAQYWINTGALLNRMNFGLALADGRIRGTAFDLLAINGNHEPESAPEALATYGAILMPGRDMNETIKRLTPLLTTPNLPQKINKAAAHNNTDEAVTMQEPDSLAEDKVTLQAGSDYRLAQVLGILLGSPEFQRR